MSAPLDTVAPVFVELAHRIVWCTVATVDPTGRPRTRILHPYWEWDGGTLTGWILTSPLSPKAKDLAELPEVSLTYWNPDHDVATAECTTTWDNSPEQREAGWKRFAEAPAPVGYDPSIIPPWTDPQAEAFGVLRLSPHRLRTMPGTVMLKGEGEVLTWRA